MTAPDTVPSPPTAALRLILGDQLSTSIAALNGADREKDVILLCEVWEEATYVRHHKKKIAFLFAAMRHFAASLREEGYRVEYITLDDENNTGSFTGEVERAVKRYTPETLITTFPGEHRVLTMMHQWQDELAIPVVIRSDDRFLSTPGEFAQWAEDRAGLRMEYFYREMRQRYDVLMKDGKPEGDRWNYDAENRKPPKGQFTVPPPYMAEPDAITKDVLVLVKERFADHFGDLEPFGMAVTRQGALDALQRFIRQRLAFFGDYQDVMVQGEPWLYHSHISFYLNCGLLLPLEVVQAAEAAYADGDVPLNAAEGFIRQILGWREYVRGLYWWKMPGYADMNHLQAERPLPQFFWDGDTDMNCLRQCITETKENAYAHHIQRLMVIGNFALLAGLHPDEVNEWYLIVYADAYQWVEMPNVTGMILFADGGLMASKPYAASGSYINKMSDYCRHCRYKVTVKNGEDACPFNYLYWDFLQRNKKHLRDSHRLAMPYKTLEKFSPEKQQGIQKDARRFLESL